jgi:hypothetical protein
MQNPPHSQPSPDQTSAPKESGFAPVRLVRALFSKQVKLKRIDAGYKFVLESTDSTSQNLGVSGAASPKAAAPAVQPAPLVTAASSLCELMDSAPGSRHAFRHLASVEHSLQSKDAEGLFLFDLSATHLKQALRQLDGLWMEPAPVPLAELRAKMADALAAQENRDKELVQSRGSFSVLSSFLVDEKMQVSEGRASDFHQLSESWDGPTLVPIER